MSDTMIQAVINTLSTVMNNTMYVLALLLVVLIAACFMGRNITLTRKMVLSSFGFFGLTIVYNVILNIIFSDIDADMLQITNTMIVAAFYIFAFVFYLFAYMEKKVRRAIESTVFFLILTYYLNAFSQMTVVYLIGGTEEVSNEIFKKTFATGPLWLAISAIAMLITSALFLIVYFGFYRQKKYFVISIPLRVVFILWIAFFVMFPFIPALLPSDDISLEYRYHIMSIIYAIEIVISGLAVPVFVIVSAAERTLREKTKSQETYLAAELEYFSQYKKQQTETRAFRHDIKNNLAMAQMMLANGQTEEASAHISDMLGSVGSLSPRFVTGDEMFDIIISMKAEKMDERNIRFNIDGTVDGGLKLKPMDMCSIFANILDNAIEASCTCDDPYITVSIKKTEKFFVIKITNSASTKIDTGMLLSSTGYTSKKDTEHHGFGLLNVRRAVEDLGGMLKAESDEKSFGLTVMLPRT